MDTIINSIPLVGADYLTHLKNLASFYGVSLSVATTLALPPLQSRKIMEMEIEPWQEKHRVASGEKPIYHWYKTTAEHSAAYAEYSNEKVVIIVPEVGRIPEVMAVLSSERQSHALIWSSELSQKEQREIWFKIRNHAAQTLVATRSALWLPLQQSFDRIIVDYEHSENHKQWDQTPRYHTKDLAKLFSRNFGVAYSEMSYSPSVTSFYFIGNGNYSSVNSAVRYFDSPIIIQEASNIKKPEKLYTSTMARIMESLVPGTDAVILYNCKGTIFPDTGIPAVVREIKQKIFDPAVHVITVSAKTPLEKITEKNSTDTRLIVSTHSILGMLDWKRVSIIILLDYDSQLQFAEYAAEEMLWHTIADILFHKNSTTPFIIQTKQLEHRIFASLNQPNDWYAGEIKARELLDYPPFSYLLRYLISGKSEDESKQRAKQTLACLEQQLTKTKKKIIIQGQIQAEPQCARGSYWEVIMLKILESDILSTVLTLNSLMPNTIKIDPHPISLLNPR